jgi:hypothetical protein
MSDIEYEDGSIMQGMHSWNEEDYLDNRINYPVHGVVLAVYPPDHPDNSSSMVSSDQRGFFWQADVYVINDGLDGHVVIPHVVIPPGGVSGVYDFNQDIPNPTTQMLDGSKFDPTLSNIDPDKLDGDRCLVQFIGGKQSQPVLTHYMPHPANRDDPSTGGWPDKVLDQGTPVRRRYKGVDITITPEGNIYLDTNGANSVLIGKEGGHVREESDIGGSLQVDMKQSQTFELNFNPPAVDSNVEPSLPQPNPPDGSYVEIREDGSTRVYMSQDAIQAIAGRVAHIMGNNDETGREDTVLLGESPTDHAVLGETHMANYNDLVAKLNAFQEAYEQHIHGSPNGNTTAPIVTSTPEASYANPCYPIVFTGGTNPPNDVIYNNCNLPAAGPLTGDLGGPEYILDEAQAAQATAATGTPVVLPPTAPGVTRAEEMTDAELSDVVKIE